MTTPTAPTPGLSGIDYGAEPPTYPDGHVCNALCRPRLGEHCELVYYRNGEPLGGLDTVMAELQEDFTGGHSDQLPFIVERAPEAQPSREIVRRWALQEYNDCPPSEVAYRYWYRYVKGEPA